MKRPIRIEGDVAYVPLTKGYEAVIDATDVSWACKYSWSAKEDRRADGSVKSVYALRRARGGKAVFLHQVVLVDALCDERPVPDHRNGNTLDNRRANLRPATGSDNSRNSTRRVDNQSGVKGVSWDTRRQRWQSHIAVNGVSIALGRFRCVTAAAIAYAKASRKLHKDFGRTA